MFYDLETDDRLAVKKAVALAVSRYNDTIGKFVQGKPERLEIVDSKIERISRECAELQRTDEGEVDRLFRAYLAEVAVTQPEHQNVTDTAEYNNSDEVPQPEHGVRQDIKATDPVLDDDADASVDLNEDSSLTGGETHERSQTKSAAGECDCDCTACKDGDHCDQGKCHVMRDSKLANPQTVTCPNCQHMMTAMQNPQNPQMTGQTQQCPNCGTQVAITPGQQQMGQPGFQQGMQTGVGGGMYAKCARCEKESAVEDSILCEACNHFVITGTEKEAQGGQDLQDPDAPLDESTQSPVEQDASTPNLPPAVEEDSNGPAEVYSAIVKEIADTEAAKVWSTPSDEDYRKIADTFGIDPAEVQKNLVIVADIGDTVAANGDVGSEINVDGMVELPGFGGQITPQEQEVDTKTAVDHTADRTGLSPDDIYTLVRESYGDDIGNRHFESVQGEAHYYLPQELVPQQQAQPDQDSAQETPVDAYQSSVPAHLRSLAAYLEYEKAQLAASAAS